MYSFDNISLLRDGKRWFPVMGEIHYSRYPHEFWKESLCKMKAGGVDIVSSYVIWIHHEEIEGNYDFSGDRDLHGFVQACKECGIKLLLRIGPWSHGEVRNGGFPDWLLKKDFQVRTNDEKYFDVVKKWYEKIYEQVKDFICSPEKDDNTIIGVQIENEYGHCGGLYDETGEDHMKRLLKIAKDAGFEVPLYTATGWGGARTGGMIPVMGGYCDAPWDPRTTKIEPSGNYIFTYERNDHNIGSDYGLGEGITFDVKKFPYLTAELGGGLQVTKHRRTVATASDIGAVTLVKLGSGVNLLGYYMYHGGTNPEGKLTTLQESKITGSLNDLPVKSYDFRAPVREFGQVSDTLKELKLYSYFVHDFCKELCLTEARIPEDNPLAPSDLEHLRYSIREDKNGSGFVFVNNYVRLEEMSTHKNVAIKIYDRKDSSHSKIVEFPPIDIKDKEYFFMPFNLKVEGAFIKYALCCPFCKLADGTTVFYKWNDEIPDSELFEFAEGSLSTAKIKVLSRKQALESWKLPDGTLFTCDDEDDYVYIDEKNKSYHIEYMIPEYENLICCKKEDNGIVRIDISKLMNEFKEKFEAGIVNDCFITLYYSGESAELYYQDKLLFDNFSVGDNNDWQIGLKRLLNSGIDFSKLILKINLLTPDMKIYYEKPIDFSNGNLCSFNGISAEYETKTLIS